MVGNARITQRTVINVFEDILKSEKNANKVVSEKRLFQIFDKNEINKIVQAYIDNNSEMVDDYKRGRTKLFSYFIGQILKETKGRLNLQILNKVFKKRLLNE